MLRPAMLIAAKDLKQRLRDRSAIVLAVVVPLGLAFILSATIGGAGEGDFTIPVAIADLDGGDVALGFRGLLDDLEAQGLLEVQEAPDAAAVAALAEDGEVSAGYVLPAGFSVAATGSEPTAIEISVNPESDIGADVATAIAQGFASEVTAVQVTISAALASGASGDIGALIDSAVAQGSPIQLQATELEGEGGFDFATFYAIGIAVFFVYFTVQFGVLGLIEEREKGTMTRLIAAPIPPTMILLGKLLSSFAVGVGSMIVLWLATGFAMGAEWGDPLGVVVMIVAAVLSAMGITALVATFAHTAEQAGGWSSIVVVVLGLMGGTFFPISQASSVLANISFLTPHRWLMEGFLDLSAGDGLVDVLPSVGFVVAFGVVTGLIGLLRARHLVTA